MTAPPVAAPYLADGRAAGVLELWLLELLVRDLTDVTEDVRREVSLRIVTNGPHLVAHTGEEIFLVLLDVEDRLLGNVLGHGDGLVGQILHAVQPVQDV